MRIDDLRTATAKIDELIFLVDKIENGHTTSKVLLSLEKSKKLLTKLLMIEKHKLINKNSCPICESDNCQC